MIQKLDFSLKTFSELKMKRKKIVWSLAAFFLLGARAGTDPIWPEPTGSGTTGHPEPSGTATSFVSDIKSA